MTRLQLHQLACSRNNRKIFHGLSLSVQAGDIIQIMGPNGCGKSSLLRQLVGLLPVHEGQIYFEGQPLATWGQTYYHAVNYLGHKNAIKSALTVRENMTFFVDAPSDVIDEQLAVLGLSAQQKIVAAALSVGQRQRLALARLCCRPTPLWLLDEPFTALDSVATHWLQQRLTQHAAQGHSVIVASHHHVAWPQARQLALMDYRV